MEEQLEVNSESAAVVSPSKATNVPSNVSSVQVAVRVRPILASEGGSDTCIETFPHSLRIGGHSGPRFSFDEVFDPNTTQEQVFDFVAPLLGATVEGYNATILAYGQTGSGKTHTVMGHSLEEEPGVIPRAVQTLFESLDERFEPVVQVQFLEVYGEEIRDLLRPMASTVLANSKLTVREQQGEPIVVGAKMEEIQNATQALRILQQGLLRRVTGATAMNTSSSRSHAMFSLHITQTIPSEEEDIPPVQRRSKFHFVDLAGSERQKRTQASGQRLKEGIDINKGLLVLGNVISALSENRSFVPYRDSKLTRLLQGSLGGNHKTLMVACVSPSSLNLEESLNCLRYANRAKNIQNVAVVNVDPATQRLQNLQAQIKVLARELLQVGEGQPATISKSNLEALAGDSSSATVTEMASFQANQPVDMIPTPTYQDYQGRPTSHGDDGDELSRMRCQLHEAQHELEGTKRQLREVQRHHETAEEQLYATKAAKQLADLQLSVATDGRGQESDSLVDAFKQQAIGYERQIGDLKSQLEQAKLDGVSSLGVLDSIDSEALVKAQEGLERDRVRLLSLQAVKNDDELGKLLGRENAVTPLPSEALEQEEVAEQTELERLTEKYLEPSESSDHPGPVGSGILQRSAVQADLMELSRSIAAKENLIDQLKLSQDKYASMQDFYESKLDQMRTSLDEKEAERDNLKRELSKATKDDPASKALGEQLKEKEKHIASLRRKQKELLDLTNVSSRNSSEINRLISDVTNMKRKKVELQKQLGSERKSHANELKKLRKDALQKDKELNKQRKITSQREAEAERASNIAKTRLEELSQMRSKFKDAEKKFRLMKVKSGVMAKAGLDPVLVGRRSAKTRPALPTATPVGHRTRSRAKESEIDTDNLRDYFDKKVADVARKESLVDKLAHEWEEHFELTSQIDALDMNEPEAEETRQALNVQIQFKEDRIRQLAQRLGKQLDGTDADRIKDVGRDHFLFDEDFKLIQSTASPEKASLVSSKVLFGMIVRERRRVANLARTASSLDERLQIASKTAMDSEAALRSYMDEQRHELVAMTQNQQEHILSLMDMVKQDSSSDSDNSRRRHKEKRNHAPSEDTLLVLASERIQVLESQLVTVQSEASVVSSYRMQIEDLKSSTTGYAAENEELNEEISSLRSSLRQIRGIVELSENGGDILPEVLEIVESMLRPGKNQSGSPRPKRSARHGRHSLLSPRTMKHVELLHTSDSTEDVDGVVSSNWTNEIMADLSLIAEGKVPPSLAGTSFDPEISEETMTSSSVFDRLANPEMYTGIQKQASKKMGDTSGRVRSPGDKKQLRRAMSKQIADQLDRIVIPDGAAQVPSDNAKKDASSTPSLESSDPKDYKSVFERLISPSHYTGTQKEKFQKSKDKRTRAAEDVAERMLDDLLGSDTDNTGDQLATDSMPARSLATEEYTQQDVFERLQRTTTHSYAVKHNGTMLPDYSDFSNSVPVDLNSSNHSERDYAHSNSQGEAGGGSEQNSQSEYISQNVFERLQKTTTEAYAKKTSKGKKEAS